MSAVDRRVRSRVQPTAALVALLALIPACPSSDVASEGGQVTLDHGLWVGMARGLASGGPVLAGSRVCLDHVTGVSGPKLDGDVLDIDGWWAECVEMAVSGPASGEGRCLTFDQGAGEVVVDMTEKTCSVPFTAGSFAADKVRFRVAEAAALEGALEVDWIERYAELGSPGPAGSWPAGWTPDPAAPLRVVAGSLVDLPVTLWEGGRLTGEAVAWPAEGASLSATVVEGTGSGEAHPITAEAGATTLMTTLAAGQRVAVELRRGADAWALGEIEGVEVGTIASVELVAGYDVIDPERLAEVGAVPVAWGDPEGVRAIDRDQDGVIVRAVQLEWRLVAGALALGDLDARIEGVAEEEWAAWEKDHSAHSIPGEYLSLADECLAPPAEPTLREATIEARVGDQVATIDLRWTALPSGAEGEFKANPGCPPAEDEGGCGCRGGEGGAPGPAALVLLVLARRRRSGAR